MSIPTLTLRALLAALLTTPLVLAQGGLQLSVVEGQGAENSIEKNLGAAIVVELRDGSGAPIPQAEITFQSPADGASVTFFGASHTSKAWTDEQGRAEAAELTPNTIPGPYKITVTAEHGGASASAEVLQSNVNPAPPEKKKRRFGPRVWIPVAVAVVLVIVGFVKD
ncbi:MAG: carboxypeptidase regulatory-like domain-containing protein [Acidobacteria bacterium]|nr:carboxypeptidase regulatory-like domain-containing protein [Acidobacteriota bacterium]